MTVRIISTEGYGLLATVELNGELMSLMDDFSMLPLNLLAPGAPEFSALFDDDQTWESMFGENAGCEKKLVARGGWAYDGYGRIASISPVVADFGLFKLDLGDFTNDPKCVGEWIMIRIERLDLTFRRGP